MNGERAGAEWNLARSGEGGRLVHRRSRSGRDRGSSHSLRRLGETGTLVIWRDLDRLFEDEAGQKRDEIVNEKLAVVERHLSLVFHRFLAGEVKGGGS